MLRSCSSKTTLYYGALKRFISEVKQAAYYGDPSLLGRCFAHDRYCKVSQNGISRVSHGKAWEDSKVNRLHTLRISVEYAAALKKRPGPKGRRSSRVLGATPDESFVQSGQRPNGLPHQLRGEMNKLFQCEPSFLEDLLRNQWTINLQREKG